MPKPTKRPWSTWSFTVRTLPGPVYAFVADMKATYGLSNWQTVILAVLGLQQRAHDSPELFEAAVAWVKEKYPDWKDGPKGDPF